LISSKAIKKWGSGSALSILDQGVLSLSNFAINIHLSRILVPKQYGLFAIVFSIYLLLLSLNQALILEPLSIVGMTRYKDNLINYFKKISVIQFTISIGLSLLMLIVTVFFYFSSNELYAPLIALVIAGPFISLFFLARRFCYLLFTPGIAFAGTVIYIAVLLLIYYRLFQINTITIFNVFLLFGAASLVSSLVIMLIIRSKFPSLLKNVVSSRIVVYKHWNLGKWLLGSSAIGWLSTSIYFPMVASLSGLEATAAFKAIDNLLLPMQQVITALSLIIIPRVAGYANRNKLFLRSISIKLTIIFTSLVVVYLGFLYIMKTEVVHLLYGANSVYIYYLGLLPLVGLSLVVRAVSDLGIGVSLRIVERFDVLFKSSVTNSIFTLTIGFFLVWKYGIFGAGIAIAIGAALQLIVSSFYFSKIFGLKRT